MLECDKDNGYGGLRSKHSNEEHFFILDQTLDAGAGHLGPHEGRDALEALILHHNGRDLKL